MLVAEFYAGSVYQSGVAMMTSNDEVAYHMPGTAFAVMAAGSNMPGLCSNGFHGIFGLRAQGNIASTMTNASCAKNPSLGCMANTCTTPRGAKLGQCMRPANSYTLPSPIEHELEARDQQAFGIYVNVRLPQHA